MKIVRQFLNNLYNSWGFRVSGIGEFQGKDFVRFATKVRGGVQGGTELGIVTVDIS